MMHAGQKLVRINLSEQTDMMDLLGADLPVQGGAPGQFALPVPPPPPPPLESPSPWLSLHTSLPQQCALHQAAAQLAHLNANRPI